MAHFRDLTSIWVSVDVFFWPEARACPVQSLGWKQEAEVTEKVEEVVLSVVTKCSSELAPQPSWMNMGDMFSSSTTPATQ